MKRPFRTIVIMAMGLSFTACQTVPKSKPLTELSDAEKRAIYVNGPINTSKKERHTWEKALYITCGVLVAIPLVVLSGLARSGSQK